LISASTEPVFRFLKKPWQPDDILEAVRQASEHVYQTRRSGGSSGCLREDDSWTQPGAGRSAQSQLLHLERLGRWQAGGRVVHDLRNLMVSLGYVEERAVSSAASPRTDLPPI